MYEATQVNLCGRCREFYFPGDLVMLTDLYGEVCDECAQDAPEPVSGVPNILISP